MDFETVQRTLDKYELSNDPAIIDDRLRIRIGQLPPEYQKQALGLYYHDAPDNPSLSRIWVPQDASVETLKHEIGHRIGDYYYGDMSEPFAENFRKKVLNKGIAMRTNPAFQLANINTGGAYTQITEIRVADNTLGLLSTQTANPGDQLQVFVTIKNIYTSTVHAYVVGTVSGNRFIDWSDVYLDPGASFEISGDLTMLANTLLAQVAIYYDGSDGQVYQDGNTASITINPTGTTYQIPSDYTLYSYVLYPAAGVYNGNADSVTFSFTAPLTVIPGVSWVVDQLLGLYVSKCIEGGYTPLELRIWSKAAVLGSTDYIVQAIAYSNNPSSRSIARNPIVLAAVIGGIVIVLGIEAIFIIKSLTSYRYGPQTTTTTTTQPVTKTLPQGQSISNTSPIVVQDNGGGDTVSTDSTGKKTNLSAGQTATIPAGSTTVAGSKGMTVTIPGETTTLTGPSNPQGTDTVTEVFKYIAIIGGIVVAGVIAIAIAQSFGKRQLYPVKS
jgi:hypothetical protein